MAGRIEMLGSNGLGQQHGELKESSLQTHKERVSSKVNELHKRFPRRVKVHRLDYDQPFIDDNILQAQLKARNGKTSISRVSIKEAEGNGTLSISFDNDGKNLYVELHKTKTGNTDVRVSYALLNDEGDAAIVDEATIKTSYGAGKSVYVASEKRVETVKGVELTASIDEESNTMKLRDDPDASGIIVPLSMNIYNELENVAKRLESGSK